MICCNQTTKFFCTRYGFANASSAWGPCDFGPLADLAISVFGKMSINTVFTRIFTSLDVGSKDTLEKNWRVSLCVQELFHPQHFL